MHYLLKGALKIFCSCLRGLSGSCCCGVAYSFVPFFMFLSLSFLLSLRYGSVLSLHYCVLIIVDCPVFVYSVLVLVIVVCPVCVIWGHRYVFYVILVIILCCRRLSVVCVMESLLLLCIVPRSFHYVLFCHCCLFVLLRVAAIVLCYCRVYVVRVSYIFGDDNHPPQIP